MFVTDIGNEKVSGVEAHLMFCPALAVMHHHGAVEHEEDFCAVVDVPFVRLISPVKPHRCPLDFGDVARAPGASGSKIANVIEDRWQVTNSF